MELVTLELRPRLQSCNAFIAVQKDQDLKDVQIKLSESNIVLIFKDCSINFLLPFIKFVPTFLSGLNVRNNWICFRLRTAPLESVLGSFDTEVVTDSNKSVQLSSSSQPTLENVKLLFKASECIVSCACCKNIISKPTAFKRVLPLPDIQCSPDEWFCCKHSSDNIVKNIETPTQESDYLYGSYFALLHKNIFINGLHIDNKTLTCDKCFLHIGTLHSCDLFQIWNCSVDYKPQNDTLSIVNATDPLNDFLIFIKDSLTGILGEEIILQTSLGKQTHYLLIKPMDRELNLITEPNQNQIICNTDASISLQQKLVAKVLYKYDTNKIANTNNHWNVEYHKVGLPMIEAGLKHLLSSTKRLPHNYRNIADYFFGYIILRESVN